MTKGNAIRYYRKFSGADAYILGFIYKHNLYAIKVAEIMPRYIQIRKSSSKSGGHEKLQFVLNNKFKEQLIRKGAMMLGNEEMLKSEQYNRGFQFEKIIYDLCDIPFKGCDNQRFDKGGDIQVNGIDYQIKLDGAQIVYFRTLNKIQQENKKARMLKNL